MNRLRAGVRSGGLSLLPALLALALTLRAVGPPRGAPCPFHVLTGWPCMFCGGTRATRALLHGELMTALVYNPFVFVGWWAVLAYALFWFGRALTGASKAPAVGRRMRYAGLLMLVASWIYLLYSSSTRAWTT